MAKRVKIEYLKQMQFDDLTISVWKDKDCEYDIDWRGAILVVRDENIPEEDIREFVDKDLIRYFRRKFDKGYVSYTEESFRNYCKKCFNYYQPRMGVRDGLVLKISNSSRYQGNFYKFFIYVSRYLNVILPHKVICWVIVHELTHFKKGYKNHVQDFEDRVSEVLDTYGYVPYED
jgi:hypothetical protein